MKLLFDENVSFRLPGLVSAEFEGSQHLTAVGMRGATDREVWEYARDNGFAIVSKDTDFRERSFVEGAPPKVIWLDVGNAGTQVIADLLRHSQARVERFESEPDSSVLVLSTGPAAL